MLDGVKVFWDGLERDRTGRRSSDDPPPRPRPHRRPPRLTGIDHLEWWVGNARTFAGFLCSAFGFEPVAYSGPGTGRSDRVSYLLRQGSMRFMVSGALHPDSPIAEHVGVTATASATSPSGWTTSTRRGRGPPAGRLGCAHPTTTPARTAPSATPRCATYGDTVHTLLDRSRYDGPFAPRFEPSDLPVPVGPGVGVVALDHVVGNVELGALERWVHFYEQVFGFCQLMHFDDDQISTEYSALMSTVVWSGEAPGAPVAAEAIVMPINEAGRGRKKSQIEEYLDFYGTPGVQHIALRTDDIVAAVRASRPGVCSS